MFWTVIRMTNVAADLGKDDRGNMWRWMKGKKKWRKCGMRRCNTNTFTDRDFYANNPYTQSLLHKNTEAFIHKVFAHRRFYTQTPFTHGGFYTQTALHTVTFTHERFSHTDPFTHRRFYTRKLLHTDAFTHRRFYTDGLHTDAFTQTNPLHTITPNKITLQYDRGTQREHTDAFPHEPFYMQTDTYRHTLLHTDAVAHGHVYTKMLLHTDTFTQIILPQFLTIEPHFVRSCRIFGHRPSLRENRN